MMSFIRQTCLATALMIGFQPAAQANSFLDQAQGDLQQLEAGKAVEREITGGESHAYRIRLEAGQFLRLVVAQKRISIAIALAGPDGKQISRLSMVSGEESLSHEAAVSGDYRITLRAAQCECTRGAYQAQAEVKAAPTAEDRKRIEAQQLVAAAFPSSGYGVHTAGPGLEKLNRALSLWRELGDRHWEAYTLSRIGSYYLPLGQPEKVIEYYEQTLAIRRELKDRYGEANALEFMGGRYSALYQSERAIEYVQQSLAIRRELKDRYGEASVFFSFGNIYYGQGQYDLATEYFEQALEIAREVKSRTNEAQVLQFLGDAYQHLGRIDKAIEYQEQALTIRREIKDWNGEANSLLFLAR
jgi:tetratricopeptide (TPR) repeat protein